ncbi:MAG TPA: hypothetical protein VG757_15935 [Devosia sp.]|nr:hypothetical protein [Devosia sp.]
MAGRVAVLAATATLGLSIAPAGAEGLHYMPPDLDYKSACAVTTVPPPDLDRDWTQWHGEAVTLVPDDMFAIAGEYLRGSARVEKSSTTAMAMLDYLDERGTISRPRIDRLLGRNLASDPAASPEQLRQAESYLLDAFDGGLDRAAADLADLYGVDGPPSLRNPQKARQFYRIAAASGDADGQLAFARILAADPNATEPERAIATENAMLGMIQRVAAGDCRFMGTIGNMYLRGELVAQDYDAALAWLEQYAETGDARTQERLAQLMTSRFVEKVDYERAMDYFEAAALQGRAPSALTVGIAYATGAQRPQNLELAQKFLNIASAGNLSDAEPWLARLYRGEFGGTPQPVLARDHYEKALATTPDPELETQFAQFLAETPEVLDPGRAAALLHHAAAGGSGQAAVLAAKLAYASAGGDLAKLKSAEAYYRLGVERGKPDAARQLAKISVCGVIGDIAPEAAAQWNERALYLGSTTALFEAAQVALSSTDPESQKRGKALMKQAAYAGLASAIAFSIAHFETGGDGYGLDLPEAQKLLRYIEVNPDPAYRAGAELELIKARLKLASDDAGIDAQYARLDQLIASGYAPASIAKADLLENAGNANPLDLAALYKVGAEAGDKRAMREYAELLADDPASAQLAPEWLKKAAAAGDLKAKIALVDLAAPTAFQDLTTIGKSGLVCSVDERVNLARTLSSLQTPDALGEAATWLETAIRVAGNDADDLYKIGDAYRDGIAGPQHVADAEDFFNRAAAAGRRDALRDIADGHMLGLWKDSTPEQARAALASLVKSGDPAAAPLMIKAIAAQQIAASLDEVEQLLAKSPASASGDTYMKLIKLDESGAFGAAHPDKQAAWLQNAADAGNTGAMMRLYRAYASGIGVPVSAETASQWLTKAAESGDLRAAGELAAAYDVGFGLAPDPVKAAYWRERAKVAG